MLYYRICVHIQFKDPFTLWACSELKNGASLPVVLKHVFFNELIHATEVPEHFASQPQNYGVVSQKRKSQCVGLKDHKCTGSVNRP